MVNHDLKWKKKLGKLTIKGVFSIVIVNNQKVSSTIINYEWPLSIAFAVGSQKKGKQIQDWKRFRHISRFGLKSLKPDSLPISDFATGIKSVRTRRRAVNS